MTPDLTPQIDAALDRMDQLLAKMKSQGKKPLERTTERQRRTLFQISIANLEDSQDGEQAQAPPVEKPEPVAKPAVTRKVFPPTTWLKRLAGA